ncbi:MAG TPA: YkgJ family cysteine cluster protein [Bryobacteraceae bacterium]|nr:YkgJ family cysteine cluster protein [Bryobacteraceae bacterium]
MRFECQPGCTVCCQQKGFVYLTEQDLPRIAHYLGMAPQDFEKRYVYRTRNLRRLRTPRATRCHFLRPEGCAIHPVKPAQCRIFPFWPELVDSAREWHRTGSWCPGIGKGDLVQIEAAREQAREMRESYPGLYH